MKKIFKKNGACVFLSTVFFLSLLAGKFATIEQMLLTELVKKSIRQKIVQQLIKKKNESPTKSRSNICLRQATNIFQFFKMNLCFDSPILEEMVLHLFYL